jgi:hypothetical protein
MLQAVYGHEKQQKSKSPYSNSLIEQDPEGAHYDFEETERSLAFEYVLILEELSPACSLISKQTKNEDDANTQTPNITEVMQNSMV